MPRKTTLSGHGLGATMLTTVAATILMFASDGIKAADTNTADAERGRLLYENHCTVCHTSVVHLREQRKATSRAEIQTWIRRWQQELGLQWGTSEVDAVTEHLNDRYYGLKSES